jgi:hypothetical protein
MPILAGGGDYSVKRERMKYRFWIVDRPLA